MKKLSIIVPVYNVEKYVEKCIKSILQQTYSEFELIIVNDGSNDKSGEICRHFAETDKRILYIEQPNGGVSSARNAALDVASGEWIGFVDADDYVDADFYETLLDQAKGGVGLVCCGVRPVDIEGNIQKHLQYNNIPETITSLNRDNAYEHFLNPSERYLYWSPWDKIIRADIAKKNRFEVGRKYGEDFFYCFKCLSLCDEIIYIPEEKYNYVLRPDSAVRSKSFTKASYDIVYFANKALKEIKTISPASAKYAEMNLAIVTARTVRSYWQLQAYNDSELKVDYYECKKILSGISDNTFKLLSINHRILILIARFLPFVFVFRQKI